MKTKLNLYDPHLLDDSFADIAVSAENLGASSNESLRDVLDLFIRIGNVLKISVTRFNQTFKRGEMEKYIQDHTLAVKSCENLNYIDVKELPVPVPTGMNATYMVAIDAVLNILSSLDIQTVISEIYKNFELIRDYVLSNQPITKTVADLNDIVNVKRKLVSRLSSESDVIFTKRNIAEGKFGSLFASMNELKVVKTKCIEAEKYLCLADDLTEKSSKLSDLVSDVTAITDKKIPKLMSVSLADSAYMAATLLDLYGSTSLNLLSISHNLTFVYNKLYERVN